MTNRCLQCDEVWVYDDRICPCCGCHAVDQNSARPATVEYVFHAKNHYDVIRIATGNSVFEEDINYLNRDLKEAEAGHA